MKEPKSDIHIRIPMRQKKQLEKVVYQKSKLSPARVTMTELIIEALEDAGYIK